MAGPLAGKTIAIIGAGPAGATAAFLLARSRQARVLLFDQRPLLHRLVPGDRRSTCGGCGGLVQAGVMNRLSELGLPLTPDVIQDALAGFTVHYPRKSATFDIPAPGMVSVYRGWGPIGGETPSESFDSFLATGANAAGAEFCAEQVTRIQLGDGRSKPALIFTERGERRVDFVIGAFGHNQALFKSIIDSRLQPAALDSAVISRGAVREYDFGPDFVEERYQRRVHIVSDPTRNIWFAALVPKRGIVSIVLMGHHDTRPADFDGLFAVPSLQHLFPSPDVKPYLKCACARSSLTISSPRRFLIPGMGGIALIGDAGPTRPRKNGLFAAIDLAENLAGCLERGGISAKALSRFRRYAMLNYVCDDIWADAMLAFTGSAPGLPIVGSFVSHALALGGAVPIITPAMQEYARLMLTGEGPYWRIPAGVVGKVVGR